MAPIRKMLAESGITEQQWRVLRVLSEFGAQDVTEVSERACLLMPSLTRIIGSLSARGLVTRSRDKKDKRRLTLMITDAGEKIIDDNLRPAAQIADRFRTTLGDSRYEELLDLLSALNGIE